MKSTRKSLKKRLFDFLSKHHDWIASGELQKLAMENGYHSPQNTGRRLRELECDGLIEVEYRKGHAWYKSKSRLKPVHYYANGVKILTKWEPVEVK